MNIFKPPNGKTSLLYSLKKLLNSSNSWKSQRATKPPKTERRLPRKVQVTITLAVFIKKNKRITKFKIRKGKYLYTFKTEKSDLAKRLADGLDGNQFEKV